MGLSLWIVYLQIYNLTKKKFIDVDETFDGENRDCFARSKSIAMKVIRKAKWKINDDIIVIYFARNIVENGFFLGKKQRDLYTVILKNEVIKDEPAILIYDKNKKEKNVIFKKDFKKEFLT